MTLKIKKLRPNAKIPSCATSGSAGMDLHACIDEPVKIAPGDLKIIPTGLAIELPDNKCAAFLYARSGLGVKHGICLSNGVGTIAARSAWDCATSAQKNIRSSPESVWLKW